MAHIIAKVEKDPNHPPRYTVYLDNDRTISVHEDVLLKHRLLKGMELDDDTIRLIVREEERERAFQQALRWLAIRSRTEKEIEQKLAERGFEGEAIAAAVQKLNDLNYLNDQQFAERFVQDRLIRQRKGKMRIVHELKKKGIDGETIQAALEQVDDGEEWEAAHALVRSRWKADEDPVKRKRRLAALLARRGFAVSLALKVIEAVRREMGEPGQDAEDWTEGWTE